MAETFETHLNVNQDGNTTPDVVDHFRTVLDDISGNTIQLDPLVKNTAAIANVKSGAVNYAWGSPTSIVPAVSAGGISDWDNLFFTVPFGMSPLEFAAWWYDGGGAALHRARLLAQAPAIDVYQFPVGLRAPESGGWFKEPLTLKKMLDGKYSDGTPMRFRAFAEAAKALNRAFPNIVTPGVSVGSTEIKDLFSQNFTGGEFNEPKGDASPSDTSLGLFPNYPDGKGSILEAGVRHYYMGTWHTPYRCRCLWIYGPYYDGLSATQKSWIQAAARSACLHNLTSSLVGQDAILAKWQELGAIIHRAFPRDILERLREAENEYLDEQAAADPANYGAVLTSMRTFIKANQVRWNYAAVDQNFRFAKTDTEADFRADV